MRNFAIRTNLAARTVSIGKVRAELAYSKVQSIYRRNAIAIETLDALSWNSTIGIAMMVSLERGAHFETLV